MTRCFRSFIGIALSLSFLFASTLVLAQEKTEKSFSSQMRAVNAVSALAGSSKVVFWGIEAVEAESVQLKLIARTTLDNIMGNEKVSCVLKARTSQALVAQCVSHDDIDLGLFMIQNGYAVADRSVIYDTVFEQPYLQAERDAQENKAGLWGAEIHDDEESGGYGWVFFLFSTLLIAFIALSVFIMRGFQRISAAQKKNMDFAQRERALVDKERRIFAMMLDSEIRANKSKIEAYITVYDEMLRSLRDPDKVPKYQTAGDLIQEQPALTRSVFDGNTDKLSILGNPLSSEVIHFYARIKSNVNYINIEHDMPLEDVTGIVEKAVQSAKKLDNISDHLIDSFEKVGLSSDRMS